MSRKGSAEPFEWCKQRRAQDAMKPYLEAEFETGGLQCADINELKLFVRHLHKAFLLM
jgi:hypothetical protein